MYRNQCKPLIKNPNPLDSDMLRESIHLFLDGYRFGVADLNDFSSISMRLLRDHAADPSIEVVWFHSAVTFLTAKFAAQLPLKRVRLAEDIFQRLVSSTDVCGALKRIAVLAPIVYLLTDLVVEKRHLELEGHVQGFLERVVAYVGICFIDASKREESEDYGLSGLGSCFMETIRAWMVDKIGIDHEEVCLKAFFPIVSDEVRSGMVKMGCGVGYVAGVVMCEALMLKLYFKFGSVTSRVELQKDVHDLAVQTMNGFRNIFFFDILFRVLLEPVLPVTHLLNSDDACLLQKVLHDAVMMMDFSFLNPQTGIQIPGDWLKDLSVKWLFVADNAISSVRKDGDQAKAISYVNAFSESCITSRLIEWITNHIGIEGKVFEPDFPNPVAFIMTLVISSSEWMLHAEEQGAKMFECEISKRLAKEVVHRSNLDDCEFEMADVAETEYLADDIMINATATDGSRKRKEGAKDDHKNQCKLVKY
ncbi:hypothetical protein FNV43_RR12699 [Rhamnella rubrinervis]|uniref:Uncharacterized protein n=1 Tax=Rhamnella rubrinervis TaxID=2594499 RepID=A0A8K0H8G0_9ROSA|nr:hypothetical protein FNV43_RR12699 [Rhamnella rubrinervis]